MEEVQLYNEILSSYKRCSKIGLKSSITFPLITLKKEDLQVKLNENMELINVFNNCIENITEKNNVTYRAGMISNGYLLTKQMAQKLKEEGRIRNVQITLDGIKEIHDLNRPLANGQGTFDAILQNIRDIIDILDISVRINVSKENFSELFKLLDLLNNEELLNKIRINIAPVSSVENTESSKIQYMCLSKSNCSWMFDLLVPMGLGVWR